MTTSQGLLTAIATKGNRPPLSRLMTAQGSPLITAQDLGNLGNWVVCADGAKLSVIAGWGTYCSPRPGDDVPDDYPGPYICVEVGFPSVRPEPWDDGWACYAEDPDDPTGTVYARVPIAMVRAFVQFHGGELDA